MTSEKLTKQNALLLQRHVDGELGDDDGEAAKALLEQSTAARVYVSALESLGEAVRIAERHAWDSADVSPAKKWVELAEASADLVDSDIDDLAPMLERFHDGEVDDAEAAVVAGLVDERDDVAEYLAELEGIATGVRQAGVADDVDFDGFWEGIAEAIDDDSSEVAGPVAVEPFDADEHRRLLYRYHDGEVSAEERRRVQAWIEAGNDEVDRYLGALAEVHIGINAGLEIAEERADIDTISAGIQPRLDAIDAERAADNVVALDTASESDADQQLWQKPMVALAAAVALLVTGALLGPQILQQDDEAMDRQPIVIFDTIESAPGSSVMLHAPQLADHDMDNGFGQNVNRVHPEIRAEDDDADPTVLWLIEDEEDPDDDDEDSEDEDELPGPI